VPTVSVDLRFPHCITKADMHTSLRVKVHHSYNILESYAMLIDSGNQDTRSAK
jgi:hypothetical protein